MGTIVIVSGLLIIAATSLQAIFGLYSIATRTISSNRLDRARLSLFKQRAGKILERVDADRAKRELTWNGKRKFRVARRVYEDRNKDICSFYIQPHDNKAVPPFRPGQFLTFELPIPGQPQPVVRCYSLSDAPREQAEYRVSIKKLGAPPNAPTGTPAGLSSNYFHDQVQEGDIIEVFAPAGEFYLDQESERPVVLIGGGVGLTPVVSMLNWLASSNSNREVWFFYGVRNREEHAMYDNIKEITRENPNIKAVVAYSQPSSTCKKGEDYDHEGFISVELIKRILSEQDDSSSAQKPSSNNYVFYICGPPPMMDMVTKDLSQWGVPEEDINFEAFGPATVKKTSGTDSATPQDGAQTFDVEFSRSKIKVQWAANMGTLLDLAESSGVKVRFGCRAGNCGTCLTALKKGEVDYLSKPGKKPEAGSCLTCISQPKSNLILDI